MRLLDNKRIFVVEDDSINRLVYRLVLSSHGAKFEFDGGGANTVSRLKQFGPVDLIIMDLMLARGATGYDLSDDIRALPQFANVPVVAVSATDAAEGVTLSRARGFNGFVAKPIDDELFPQQLEKIINGEPVWYTGPVSVA